MTFEMWQVIVGSVVILVLLFATFIAGFIYRKNVAEKELGSAEDKAKNILSEAIKTAEAKKKEALIEAKDEIHKLRTGLDKETKERRAELQKNERRLLSREESIDKRLDNLDKKEEAISAKAQDAENALSEANELKKRQFEMLEKVSGYTAEQAKTQLLQMLDGELVHEKAVKITQHEQKLQDEADEMARKIISLSISRLAAESVSEATVSVVPLPSDEMKGRIIGREGRNIRTLESLTGVDLIIDDTPEAITVSCFDPVRREIARQTLERLITDGRIHPARIEEMAEKSKRDIEHKIKKEGENAVMTVGIHGLHPEIVKTLGRLYYRTSYGQNVLDHSIEVAYLAGIMASELGLDPAIAKRAGLLHDLGKALDHEIEGSHVEIGVNLARKHKENEDVIHAIEAHHGDVEAKTVVACLIQAADAISAARPGARRENIENYIKRLQKLEEIACSFVGVEKCFAIQAGREIRVMVRPEQVSDDQMVLTAREMAAKIEDELSYPGQIKINMIRESRVTDFAK